MFSFLKNKKHFACVCVFSPILACRRRRPLLLYYKVLHVSARNSSIGMDVIHTTNHYFISSILADGFTFYYEPNRQKQQVFCRRSCLPIERLKKKNGDGGIIIRKIKNELVELLSSVAQNHRKSSRIFFFLF